MADIRPVRPDEWKSLKAIRLRSLTDSPDAFCVTYEEVIGYGDEVWKDRAADQPQPTPSMSAVAVDGGEFVGMAAGIMCDDDALDVVSVWVSPEHRGSGMAQELMECVEQWGVEHGAVSARLDVESSNERAGKFYAGIGYTSTGVRETYPGRTWLQRVLLQKDLVAAEAAQ